MLKAINHIQVSIPRGSEERARQFYCGMLGLHEIPKPDSLADRGGFWSELGGLQIHFGAEDGVNRELTKAHVAYEVENLASWRERLARDGFAVLDGIPVPGMDRLEFRDPFGNRVELLERQSGKSASG